MKSAGGSNNHDQKSSMKAESSGGDGLAARKSKSAQKLGGIDEGGVDDHKKRSGEAAGGFKGENSGGRTEEMETEASSDPKTLAAALSSDDLREVPVEYGMQPFDSVEKLKDHVALLDKEVPKTFANETAVANPQNVLSAGTLSSELSPTSVTQFVSSLPSPALTEHKMSLVEKRSLSDIQVQNRNSFDPNTLAAVSGQKTPSSDGYNWRKYGQKQVKSPQGSRSYYRCTHADCYAKKIECSDQSNRVLEIVYKSPHSHDPPQKVNCTRLSRLSSPVALVNRNKSSVSPMGLIADFFPSTPPVDSAHETAAITDPKLKEPMKSNDIAETAEQEHIDEPEPRKSNDITETVEQEYIDEPKPRKSDDIAESVKQEHIDELEPRKRLKKTDPSCPESPSKAVKKSKVVVHAAGDVGISGDGFRWRKYGQKMVKGNPHPRNYYRCTSAGCPVRKHIEMAKDNTNASIITYKGVHDHDMPVPKKRHGPPSAPLVAAVTPTSMVAPTSMNSLPIVKSEGVSNQESATQWSVDKECELKGQTLECGMEKPLDSTRALLSIGFEIKPC